MPNDNSGSVRNRRRKRRVIIERLHELQYETPIQRVRMMNQEFGPYWYFYLKFDAKIPEKLMFNDRYLRWVKSVNPNQEKS